jgi:hypothetical protein
MPVIGQPVYPRDPAPAATAVTDTPADNAPSFRSIYESDTRSSDSGYQDVTTASGERPLVPIRPKRVIPAEAILQQALARPAGSVSGGSDVTLRETVQRVTGQGNQVAAVSAYWHVSHALAAYHYAQDEVDFFARLARPQSRYQKAVLAAAQAAAEARQSERRLEVIQAQHALVQVARLPGEADKLPVAVDLPFVGVYRTHFHTLNARGAAPDHLREIDNALPATRELIDAYATAIYSSQEALVELQQAYEQGLVSLSEVLDAHRRLRGQRGRFLEVVRGYNQKIAQYALSVSSLPATPDKIVGMLIETPSPAGRSVLIANGSSEDTTDSGEDTIRRVSNEEPTETRRPQE